MESSSPVDEDDKPAVDLLMVESSLQVDEDETPVVTQHALTSEKNRASVDKKSGAAC